jgi:4-hydroxy-3-methylbut-2-enyl diphosphate reductase
VIRAIDIVEIALERLGSPVYVRKEIVHNRFVVDDLASRGAVFVESLDEVPDGAVTIFSAHGVEPEVRKEAERKRLRVIDATCPLVTKVHIEVIRYAQEGYNIVLVGHQNHDEVVGTFGEAPNHIHIVSTVEDVDALQLDQPERVIYATQTTLSLDDTQSIVDRLKERFPSIISPASSDICYATQNRQIAVKTLADSSDLVLVVGSENSSNSNRLVEVARGKGTTAYLIGSARDIRPEWMDGCTTVGVTAGASTPEILVQEVVKELRNLGFVNTRELELIEENVLFPLPAPFDKIERVSSVN